MADQAQAVQSEAAETSEAVSATVAVTDAQDARADTAPLHIDRPAPGEAEVYEVQAGQTVTLAFDLKEPEVIASDENIEIIFEDGAQVTLEGLLGGSFGDLPPVFILADGTVVTLLELIDIAAVLADYLQDIAALETAAGGPTSGVVSGGGAGFRSLEVPEIGDGLDATDPLGNTELSRDPRFFSYDTRDLPEADGAGTSGGGTSTGGTSAGGNASEPAGPIGPLFSEQPNPVDFDAVAAASYEEGTQYDAMDGEDVVYLPSDGIQAAEAGFEVGHAFNAGSGHDTIVGRGLDDTIEGGSGDDILIGGAGNDVLHGEDSSGGETLSVEHHWVTTAVAPGLGEGQRIDPSHYAAVTRGDFTLAANHSVTLTFMDETAGYKNSLGYYRVGPDGQLVAPEFVWANTSKQGSGGSLDAGQETVELDVGAGEQFGLFIVANGYLENRFADFAGGRFEFRDASGNPATLETNDPQLFWISEDGASETRVAGSVYHAFGNTMNPDDAQHAVAGVDAETGGLTVGFEDLTNLGDSDFSDVMVRVDIGPAQVQIGGADTLDGGAGDDRVFGDGGNDVLTGGAGYDYVDGGQGDDILHVANDGTWTGGYSAFNTVTGETVSLEGRHGSFDIFEGGEGDDTLMGSAADDAIFLDDGINGAIEGEGGPRIRGIETIDAGDGDDIVDLTSDSYEYGDVELRGGAGNDVLWSNRGDDRLIGGEGDDRLFGGAGEDTLYGGQGSDDLTGGLGRDVFAWAAEDIDGNADTIHDFVSGTDKLDLSAVLDGFGESSVVEDFVKTTEDGGNTKLWVNSDGAGDWVEVASFEGITAIDLQQDVITN